MKAGSRYAAYWAPPVGHPLWRAGCDWLGRDAETGALDPAPRPHTAEPRRYGFHATLKAPIALREGRGEADFIAAVAAIAASTPRFAMPALEVGTLHDFVALRPRAALPQHHPLRRLADACVRELDPLRGPASAAEVARRLGASALDEAQRENVRRWGYAHVFDHWRMHLTLSDAIEDGALRERIAEAARAHFEAALGRPLICDAIAVFVEGAPGASLRLLRRVPLAAG